MKVNYTLKDAAKEMVKKLESTGNPCYIIIGFDKDGNIETAFSSDGHHDIVQEVKGENEMLYDWGVLAPRDYHNWTDSERLEAIVGFEWALEQHYPDENGDLTIRLKFKNEE